MRAPCTDCTDIAKMPRMTKPMWLTDEYATSFLKSGCTMATSAPYTIPMTASVRIAKRTGGYAATPGKSGTAKRTNPNVPIFSMIDARITDPAVGASTCASGSQVWNGHIGIFTAKDAKKANQAHICKERGTAVCIRVGMSVVPAFQYSAMIASSIKTEPRNV